jgi:hypothetical protein
VARRKHGDSPDGRGGSWENRRTAARNHRLAPATGGLSRVPAAGGEPVQVTALDSSRQEISHRQPELLPDGRHFLYVAISNRTDNNGIFIGDSQARLDDKKVSRLMVGASHVCYASSGHLLFLQDDNLMAQTFDARKLVLSGQPAVVVNRVVHGVNGHTSDFSVSANGILVWRSLAGVTRQLTWFDRSGKQIRDLDARGRTSIHSLADGERVAVSKLDPLVPPTGNIWLFNPARGGNAHLWERARLFPSGHRMRGGCVRQNSATRALACTAQMFCADEESCC